MCYDSMSYMTSTLRGCCPKKGRIEYKEIKIHEEKKRYAKAVKKKWQKSEKKRYKEDAKILSQQKYYCKRFRIASSIMKISNQQDMSTN